MVERCSSRPHATMDSFYYESDQGSSNSLDSDNSISSGDCFVEVHPNVDLTDHNPDVPAPKITRKKTGRVTISTPSPKRKSLGISDAFGEDAIKMLYSNTHLEEEKLTEAKRHNKCVEKEFIAKGEKEKHDYTMQILKDFQELRKTGMNVEDIIAIFPDMAQFDDR